MKYFITNFYNIRFFKPNMIPISTAIWDPKWYHNNQNQSFCFLDKNNVINGIREETLMLPIKLYQEAGEPCSRECKYTPYIPNCPFMDSYSKYLETVDFNYLLSEFKRVAEDVRKINNYEGEPEIVLMVHEKPSILCAERPCLVKLFKENNIDLVEWSK